MRLRSKMDDAINLLILHQLIERLEITDIHLHEPVVRLVLDITKIGKIPGISQLIDIDYLIIRIFVDKQPDYMTPDKSGTSGDYYGPFHEIKDNRY